MSTEMTVPSVMGAPISEYSIVIFEGCPYREERFARRLRFIIKKKWGCELPLITDGSCTERAIIIGRSALPVGRNEYVISVEGKSICIAADSIYGYEYAYDMLAADGAEALLCGAAEASGEICRQSIEDGLRADKVPTLIDKVGQLRLLQFNILGEDYDIHPFVLASRIVREMVEAILPDVMPIQEYTLPAQDPNHYPLGDTLCELGYAMADGKKTVYDGHKVGTVIFYRTDVFELVYEDTYNPTRGHTGKYTTSAVLKRRSDGKLLAIVNCHLAHEQTEEFDELRGVQITEAMDTARELHERFGCDVFLTGDLNSKPKGRAYTMLLRNCFKNTHDIADVTDNHTTYWGDDPYFNREAYVLERPRERRSPYGVTACDHTFCLGDAIAVRRFDVLTDPCSLSVSDHAATAIDFDLY